MVAARRVSPTRRTFVAGTVASLLVAASPSFAVENAGEHKHGTNGIAIPIDKHINLSIRVLDGPDWRLQDHRGMVVFMNFFATWCPPCRDETPAFVDYAARDLDGVAIIGIDIGENDDVVRGWRKKFQVPYPIGMDQQNSYATQLKLHSYPTTLVFRPDGRISCAVVGSMDADDLAAERAYALDTSRDVIPSPSPPAAVRT